MAAEPHPSVRRKVATGTGFGTGKAGYRSMSALKGPETRTVQVALSDPFHVLAVNEPVAAFADKLGGAQVHVIADPERKTRRGTGCCQLGAQREPRGAGRQAAHPCGPSRGTGEQGRCPLGRGLASPPPAPASSPIQQAGQKSKPEPGQAGDANARSQPQISPPPSRSSVHFSGPRAGELAGGPSGLPKRNPAPSPAAPPPPHTRSEGALHPPALAVHDLQVHVDPEDEHVALDAHLAERGGGQGVGQGHHPQGTAQRRVRVGEGGQPGAEAAGHVDHLQGATQQPVGRRPAEKEGGSVAPPPAARCAPAGPAAREGAPTL